VRDLTRAGVRGAHIKLTIDSSVQSTIVEPKLSALIREFKAASGTIVVERASDGAIIAMASRPSRDARTWQQLAARDDFSSFPNPAISDPITPGQIMEPLLMGAGFDSGIFSQRTLVNDPGIYRTDGITIHDWCLNACGFGGMETVQTMLHYGSDIAATKFAQLIPTQAFYQYLDRFGFGLRTGIDLPNEVTGMVISPYQMINGKRQANARWRRANQDTAATGQSGMAVTPLQLINAYAALANGGNLMQPRIIQSYTLNGKTITIPPKLLHRVFQHGDTAEQVTKVLAQSAVNGVSCQALVSGYDVAAITGATGIHTEHPGQTTADTIAYGPVGEPDPANHFVVLVELQHPTIPWGSEVAAPAVSVILRQLFKHYGLSSRPNHTQPSQRCLGPLIPPNG
jgi:cell division protein FtsI/penicillin-binding protein 2